MRRLIILFSPLVRCETYLPTVRHVKFHNRKMLYVIGIYYRRAPANGFLYDNIPYFVPSNFSPGHFGLWP